MTERVCKGCGGELPTMHGNRRYCSENCRKRLYDREVYRRDCADCGKDIDAHGERCAQCETTRRHAEHEALLDRIEEMWNDGLLYREMAVALGRNAFKGVTGEIHELRRRGRIGYRNKGWKREAA